MRIGGKEFSPSLMQRIEALAKEQPEMSRRALSRQVCEWLDWRGADGGWSDASCRKALGVLAHRGLLQLPAATRPLMKRATGFCRPTLKATCFEGPLAQLGAVTVEPVGYRRSRAAQSWNAMMARYHPLGRPRLCGAQLRYIIRSEHHGEVGALAFNAAAWALQARDEHIGWNETARMAHLGQVVCNSRFLILPTVRVPNLASHALSLAVRRLPQDWQQRYGAQPMLLETYVQAAQYRGACYRAANWVEVGESSGRRDGQAKRILLYALRRDWRRVLCAEPSRELGQRPRPEAPRSWAEEEFGTVPLYDPRLHRRLYTVAEDFYNKPQSNIPEACGGATKAKGAYRFLNNRKVTMDVVLHGHKEATLERIRDHRLVLAPQDTTELSYATHPATEGLGPLNNTDDKAMGLILHDTLAFSEEGTPLGVLDAQCWARDPNDKGKRYRRKQLPLEEKESAKWLRSFRAVAEIQKQCPQTTLVSMGDREADIYELFAEAVADPHGPKLLVRAERTRLRRVGEDEEELKGLWSFMGGLPCAGQLEVRVVRRPRRPARVARLDVRFAAVQVKPPKNRALPPVKLWAVYVHETPATAQGVETPLEWMLLTTVPVEDFAAAQRAVEWYTGRWGIEVYHRTLKSGCRIEDRRLGDARGLQACLAVDMVVAWRIYHLTMLGREKPDHPCTAFFTELEWKALWCFIHGTTQPPEQPPTMHTAVRMVGGLGGHLGRKSDGPPGTQTLWRGLQRLDDIAHMYAVFTHRIAPTPFASGP